MHIFLVRDGKTVGPLSLETVQVLVDSRFSNGWDLAWFEGTPRWIPLEQVPGVRPPRGAAKFPAPFPAPALPDTKPIPTSEEVFPIGKLKGHGGTIFWAAILGDNLHVVTASHDNTLRFWNLDSGNCVQISHGPGKFQDPEWGPSQPFFFRACLSPNEKYVLITDSKPDDIYNDDGWGTDVHLWDFALGEKVLEFKSPTFYVADLCFNPTGDSAFTASPEGHTLRQWDVGTGAWIKDFSGHGAAVTAVAHSPVKPLLASGSRDGALRLWRVDTGESLILGHQEEIETLCFNSNGRLLLSGSVAAIRLWDLENKKCICDLNIDSPVTSACLLPKTLGVLSGHLDGSVRLWNWTTDELVYSLSGHAGAARILCTNQDGHTALTCGEDYIIRLWHMDWPLSLRVP